MILRNDFGGFGYDVRRGGKWGIGAEILLRKESTSQRKTNDNDDNDDSNDDSDAVTGLLRTIQKPLSSIGRIFGDDSSSQNSGLKPASTPLSSSTPRKTSPDGRSQEAAARQASAEAAQAQKVRSREYKVVVE